MLDKELPKNISSCIGLIISQSRHAYASIPKEHKRWIEMEDVIQEGYIAAIEANKAFRPHGAKYSTFLFNGLTFHYNHEFARKLYQQKRTASLDEIDAPEGSVLMETKESMLPDSTMNSVDAFIGLCKRLSPEAVVWFIGTLLSDTETWSRAVPLSGARSNRLKDEVKKAVQEQGYSRYELELLRNDEKAQKMALITLAQNSSIGLGTEMDARILECIECQGRFALAAIRAGRYVVLTRTCLECYRKMQEADAKESCFGKAKTDEHEGYSEHDIECTLHCKDRKVCRQFVKDEGNNMKDKKNKKSAAEETETNSTTAVAEEEETATPPKKKVSASAEAPAKPAKKKAKAEANGDSNGKKGKSAKAAKEEKAPKKGVGKAAKASSNGDYPAPKDVVRWPHKSGSWMQYCFQRAYQGVKANELETETNESGRKWAIFLKVLRGGKSGMKRPTHTWRLDETGGRLKISDVKFLGAAE